MYEEYLNFAKSIAYNAGKIMKEYFINDNQSSYKSDNTIVTIADKKINDYLIEKVKEKYPTHSVCGEENSFGNSKYSWICDPIDGTAMYARHVPVSVFSLAFAIEGNPIVGVIYDPFTDNLYSAIRGQGAYKNDEKICVNDLDLYDIKSVSNYDMWGKSEYDIYDLVKVVGNKSYLVSIGSVIRACMCVAEGNFVSAIFPGTINKNYDIAAVQVIVEEAGGKVTDLFGNEQRYDQKINGALISNGKTHEELLELIKKYVKENKKED